MQLYRLTLATIIQRKVWVVALLWLIALPLVLPNIMTYQNISLVQPARAQAAWVSLWGIAITWILFQAARFGDETARSGLGAYFLSVGKSNTKQLFQIWAACMSFLLPLVVLTIAVCLFGAMPDNAAQAEMWLLLNSQYALLFLLVIAPLLLLAIALGSRMGGSVGYIVPVALVLYGLYGVGHLASIANTANGPVLNWMYVFSPHYHLADLTERLVFKQGSMVGSEFFQIVGYFVGIGSVTAVFSSLYFRAKSAV